MKLLGIGILLLPLLGAALAGGLGRPIFRGQSHFPVILGVAGAVVCSIAIFFKINGLSHHDEPISWMVPVYDWLAAGGGTWFQIDFLIDPLSCVMLMTVTFISLLVVIYSRDYMRDHDHPERGYERFFAFMGLFVFSMCALVLGGNFVLLYLGWEAVGLCSYLLIGFYYQRPAAAAAAKKAFLVNRIGDFGFGLAIFLIYLTIGHLDYATVFDAVKAATAHGGHGDPAALAGVLGLDLTAATEVMHSIQDRVTIIALLLFCGAIGKSAQLPLYVWLPDAMEGPSPVSALIHAATMVTAGVYMVARCGAIFAASPVAMTVVAVIGGVTALFAATIALTQHDMKRILAYSTISQLGYMFLGLGCFAAASAIFHLMTHAFFKALLFLAAGSMMHAMGGIIDLREFGGLRKVLPWTYRVFVIGSLSLAGFPLLAGFWSKDEIIHAAFLHNPVFGLIGLVTAVLTAFYTFRMVFRAFAGEERIPEGVHVHESGKWMLIPLGVLSLGAIFAGYFGVTWHLGGFVGFFEPHGALHHFLDPVMEPFTHAQGHAEHAEGGGHFMLYLSAVLAIGGIVAAYVVYVRRPWIPGLVRTAYPEAHRVLFNKYYVDEGYDKAIIKPLRSSGRFCFGLDEYLIDGIIWFVTAVPRVLAFGLRSFQHGALQGYGVSMVAGLAIIVLLVLFA
ncbi:MAG: NADH-quinone oxidoreductase subunit L [Phycisphaerae bacterium]|nr:NADH-quinone oxidoreductase subunit L [Phycisphaerae bacterium]